MTTVRDFIYLDVEKLYSLYSQVFEGVADRIVQSYIDSLESKEAPRKTLLLRDSDVETKVIEVSRRTENRFLYDHMYNQLEGKLGNTIFNIAEAPTENYAQTLKQVFAIRVTGSAEIEDFQRIRQFFDQFNSMGSALHYITSFDPVKAKVAELESHRTEKTRRKCQGQK